MNPEKNESQESNEQSSFEKCRQQLEQEMQVHLSKLEQEKLESEDRVDVEEAIIDISARIKYLELAEAKRIKTGKTLLETVDDDNTETKALRKKEDMPDYLVERNVRIREIRNMISMAERE